MIAARMPMPAVSGLLLMTGFVCTLELMILVRCLSSGQSPAMTALVLAGFHLGYLGADSAARCLGPRTTCALASSATATVGAACTILGSTWSLVVLVMSSMLLNTTVQAARRRLKAQAKMSSAVKNAAKATGMITGGLLGASAWLPLLLIIPAVVILYRGFASGPVMNSKITKHAVVQRSKMLLWSEFLHHAHYFAYCYTFWYLAPSLIGPLTGVWFLIGWLAYFVAEFALAERRTDFSPRFMASGHALVAAILVAMPFLPTATALVAWFVTGIGGGTAYMLGNAGPEGKRERYEDTGHVVGAFLAAAAATTHETAAAGAAATTFLAASLAAAAAAAFWCVRTSCDSSVSTTIGT